jgi:hypothetical protein
MIIKEKQSCPTYIVLIETWENKHLLRTESLFANDLEDARALAYAIANTSTDKIDRRTNALVGNTSLSG